MEEESSRRAAESARGDERALRASLNDARWFAVVYERCVADIYGCIAIRVGPSDADRVVARTFVTAFDHRCRFDPTAATVCQWLYSCAVGVLRSHRDTERHWLERRASADPTMARDRGAPQPQLAATLLSLSPPTRDVMLLHVIDGLDHDEIARVLRIRARTARSRLKRGRAAVCDDDVAQLRSDVATLVPPANVRVRVGQRIDAHVARAEGR